MGARSFWVEAIGAEVRFRDAGGFRTRSIEAGSGHPIILLHGLSGHAESFIRNVLPLAGARRVYALDMLGHGLTAKPAVDYTIDVLADHVLGFMDAIGAQSADFIGQSLGGWVAGWLAARQPGRVSRYVCATGAGLEVSPEGAALTREIGKKVADATNRATGHATRENVRERLQWLMYDKSVVTDELVDVRHAIYSDPAFAAIARRLVDGITGPDAPSPRLTPDVLARVECPTLVLWTRHNPTMPWHVGEAASRLIPNCSFYMMEDAGHWPQFEKPDEFNAVVLDFLRGSGSA